MFYTSRRAQLIFLTNYGGPWVVKPNFTWVFSTPLITTEYYFAHLIFVKLTIFIRRLSFTLKGNNDETDEYIDHKEGNNDDINKIEASHDLSIIMNGAMIFHIRVD
jgi:hypothetical protein